MQPCRRSRFPLGETALLWLAVAAAHAASPVTISEFVASNHLGLADEDGIRRDWIEIYNPGASLDLEGWYLTDDPDDLTKWEFPSTPLAAGGYLVVFASDMDRAVSGAPLHTNLELSANAGSYLALVQPNGTTISYAYTSYPAQYSDVSYGLSGSTAGYLQSPTPGAANSGLRPLPPVLTPGGKFYAGVCTVTVSNPAGTGTVRYTTNGTVPTLTNGFTYSAPLSLSTTATLRMAVYVNGIGSPVVTERYVRLGNDLLSFSSNLPLVVVHTLGTAIPEDPQVLCAATLIDTTNGTATLTDPPNFVGVAGIKLRGSSSLMFPKKQYAFEIWDHNADDENIPLLDLPTEADWVLYGPYTDKTLMRNVLAYQWSNAFGRYAPRTRFVEMFLHTAPGMVTGNDYVGTYVLIEKIKRDKNRVNIAKLRPDDNTEPTITGGYIVKKDRLDPGDTGFYTSIGQQLAYVEPKEEEISAAQAAYLSGYFNAFEAALYGPNYTDPVVGYAKYLDVDSWIDQHILVELTKNIDGYRLSAFMFKDRNGKLNMGPAWDYNLSLGNADYLEGWIPLGWYYPLLSDADYPWFPRLFTDQAFRLRYADRWFALRKSVLQTSQLLAEIDGYVDLLAESQVRNFQRWPILGTYVWPNAPGWETRPTYQDEINWMKNWLVDRLTWIDSQFVAPPVFNQDGGSVPFGFQLAMSPPPGVSGTIYYTLDGSDPYGGSLETVTLIAEDAGKRVRVPTGPIAGWQGSVFNDLSWTAGTGGVGYERSTGYESYFNIDVGSAMYGQNGTCYIRVPFNVSANDLPALTGLKLRVRYDDGFIAHLNGQEIARTGNAPASAVWNSTASYTHDDADAIVFEEFDVSPFVGQLHAGANVLAIQGLNSPATSSDFLISLELNALKVSTATALPYTGPITLSGSTQVIARMFTNNNWGARNEAIFTVGPRLLFINEFMADNESVLEDPDEPGEYPDWLELYNASPYTAFIGGMYMTDNLSNPTKWQIPAGVTIPAGGYLLFYCDEDPSQGPTHANFKLSKSGEALGLFDTDANGHAPIDTFAFGVQQEDVSYGRYPNGAASWRFFVQSTPGSANFVRGDLNVDGAIDAGDLAFLADCMAGPGIAPDPSCAVSDLEADQDVDLGDLAELQTLVGQ